MARRGGLPGLAGQLGSNVATGISSQGEGVLAFEQHQSVFGQNRFKELPQKSFFMLLWENLQDPTLILLMIAALVRAFCCPSSHAILLTVLATKHKAIEP